MDLNFSYIGEIMDLDQLRKAIDDRQIEWKKHALSRMLERGISRSDVLSVILDGDIIEQYPDDNPYPSLLMYKYVSERPIHAVVAYNSDDRKAYVITAYEPSEDTFEDDFMTRRDD